MLIIFVISSDLLSRATFNSAAARSILWTILYSMVSSAKSLMLVPMYFTMSFMKTRINIGPMIDP